MDEKVTKSSQIVFLVIRNSLLFFICIGNNAIKHCYINYVPLMQSFHTYALSTDTGFGTTGGFGTSAFGTTTNTGGLFGSTQNKPGLSFIVCL